MPVIASGLWRIPPEANVAYAPAMFSGETRPVPRMLDGTGGR